MDKSIKKQLAKIFLCSLVIHTIIVVSLPDIQTTPDSFEYLSCAESILEEGRFYYQGKPESFRTPGYPAFLALLQWLSVDSLRSIAWFHGLLSSIEIVMVFWIIQRISSPKTAWIAAVILMLNPGGWHNTTSMLTETLFSFVLTTILLVSVMRNYISVGRSVIIGLLCGYVSLVRPIAVYLFIPLVGWLLYTHWAKGCWRVGISFLAAIVLLQGGWILRNYSHYDEMYFTELNAANLYAFWGQAIAAQESGEDFNQRIDDAITEWHSARKELTPPQMMDRFYPKAWKLLEGHEWMIVQIMAAGAYRQMIESGWVKMVARYDPDNQYHVSAIVHELTNPNEINRWLYFAAVMSIRLMETGVNVLLYAFAFVTCCWLMRKNHFSHEQKKTLWLAFVLAGYMFVLSCGPAASVRFREQYFPILVVLAAPMIDWICIKMIRVR